MIEGLATTMLASYPGPQREEELISVTVMPKSSHALSCQSSLKLAATAS